MNNKTKTLLYSFLLITSCLKVDGASKYYSGENKPYEFGFRIEGEQHRKEMKDENGIIMGEFGFATADGIYHVTVYATDENGDFKILSMKNIKLGEEGQDKPAPKTNAPPITPQRPSPVAQRPQAPQRPSPVAQRPQAPEPPQMQPGRSCSHCSIPNSQGSQNGIQNPHRKPQGSYGGRPNSAGQNNQGSGQNPRYNSNAGSRPQPQNPGQQGFGNQRPNSYGNQKPNSYGNQNPNNLNNQGNQGNRPNQGANPSQDNRQPKSFDGATAPSCGKCEKPKLFSAQMNIVSKNTDINRKSPGEKSGLPKGVTKKYMENLLYTFNYTVGFHGHQEEGYQNGAKKGYYFITGRDGKKLRVDYEADENGFRPTITEEILDLASEEVPKEETEKDELYGLKSYEFKWFYYPV